MWTDRQTYKKQTELHQFRKEPIPMMVIYLPVKIELDKRFSSPGTKMWTDRRTHQSNRRVIYMQPT